MTVLLGSYRQAASLIWSALNALNDMSSVFGAGIRKFHVYSIPENILYSGYNMRPETCPFFMYSSEIVVPELIKRHSSLYESNPDKAKFYVVPQFSTCFYHFCLQEAGNNVEICKEKTQKYFDDIVDWVEERYPYWNQNGGNDHVFVFSWDQGSEILGHNSPTHHRIQSCIHLVHHGKRVADDSNYISQKDVIIPVYRDYFALDRLSGKHMERKIFAYFRGTIENSEHIYGHGVRRFIKYLGQTKPTKYFVKEGHNEFYWNEISRSTFTLCPPGWSLWSPRLYDAILAGSIPIIFGDDWVLPFEGLIDYEKILVRIDKSEIKSLDDILSKKDDVDIELKRLNIRAVASKLRYHDHHVESGPIDLMLKEILEKHA